MATEAWIVIDTHRTGECRVAVLDAARVQEWRKAGRGSTAVSLLAARAFALLRDRRSVGVCVVRGPGSFSSIRAGVLLGNLLAHAFGVPLVGIDATEADDLATLRGRLVRGEVAAVDFVAPVYDAEPNITLQPRPFV